MYKVNYRSKYQTENYGILAECMILLETNADSALSKHKLNSLFYIIDLKN